MKGFKRADYARSTYTSGATIAHVAPGSPADRAGLKAHMILDSLNGHVLRDVIDWQWLSDGTHLVLEGRVPAHIDGNSECYEFEVELQREYGEAWGIDFQNLVFDGIKVCNNACTFCFMSMLPEDLRTTLYIKDDDFRLSFLQGNFVTFTNISDDDLQRIIEQRLSPLNMSLHAIDPNIRARLIGKHAPRGLEVLEELLAHDIEIHAQIVLCPGLNDEDILKETLDYVEERSLITSLAVVPVGYTKYQKRIASSFNEKVLAKRVIETIKPYQERSWKKFGLSRFQVADEFYLNAQELPPSAQYYDGYPQYYDGIGMYRSFLDDIEALKADKSSSYYRALNLLKDAGLKLMLVAGYAFKDVLNQALDSEYIEVGAIKNDFFGGNVDVSGLLVESDILSQLPEDLSHKLIALPELMFNFDGMSLENMHKDELKVLLEQRGAQVLLVPSEIIDLFDELIAYLNRSHLGLANNKY
ncbi:MAG: DUF512 domain-containing protein [Coriobacteriia bacterium]|nr:DUF512 domain-containing protein [Coriobacteriia bacterium]